MYSVREHAFTLLHTRFCAVVGVVVWYVAPSVHVAHAVHARLEPLPLAHEEVWYVAPLHAERHVLQPRLRELVGDVDWYWLLPQFVHAAHARLEPLPLAHEEVWYVAPLHAERHVLQPASPSGMAAPPSPITCSTLQR
jgi:hypothetical protein